MANLLNPIAGLPLGHPEGGETLIGTIPASMAEQLQALQPERPEHESQDPKLFGPGFATAPTHSATESQIKYVLVTPEMLRGLAQDRHPTNVIVPSGAGMYYQPGMTGTNARPSLDLQPAPQHPYDSPPLTATEDFSSSIAKKLSQEVQHLEHSPETEKEQMVTVIAEMSTDVNPLMRFRTSMKEYFGEFLGTAVMITFGNGVNCQVVLSNLTQGSYLSISFGWGISVMCGVYVAGGISGAHLNPAVRIAASIFGYPSSIWTYRSGYWFYTAALGPIVGGLLGCFLYDLLIFNGPASPLNRPWGRRGKVSKSKVVSLTVV